MSLAESAPLASEPACSAALEPSACAPVLPSRGTCLLTLALRHAGARAVRVAWECIGAAGAPLLVVQGGISAGRHVAASDAHGEPGWWDAQVGCGRAIDPRRWRVLSFDWLGADGALDVTLDPADQADALAALLDVLGLAAVHAFIGASYGAMVGLQFAARHPHRLGRLVALSGAHRAHPQATALRVVQRRIVKLGRSQAAVQEALALARALAVVGYRSPDEFGSRFQSTPAVQAQRVRFAVEDYFDAIGPRFAARFTPTAYLRLSESIDLQRVEPAAVRVPTWLLGVTQDQIVPPADLRALAAGLGGKAVLQMLDSPFGHDAFLKEPAAVAAVLTEALAAGADA